MYRNVIKRALDIILSGCGILVLSPVLVVLAILVKGTKGPVLFKQKRVGKGKKLFEIYKFRSMYADTPHDVPTHLLENPDSLITPIGHFLRKSSLDELPQLFNIFKGEMSVVGPRPALWNQDDLIAERDKYGANDCVPGLTGYAQILQNLLPFRTVELLLGPVDPAAAEAKSVCSEHEVSHYQAPVVEIGG